MKTTDYTVFRTINGNRKTNSGHVLRLSRAIERKNLLPYYPILCNENMEVIDGQHRLAAATRLGYEVHYAKIAGLKIEDVMEINTNSKSWSLRDFINSWIVLGKPDYRTLRDMSEKYGINPTIAAGLLGGSKYLRSGGNISRDIRGGVFKVATEEMAHKVAEQLTQLKRYADFVFTSDREFIAALVRLNYNPVFDFEQLLSKLQLHQLKIEKRVSEKYYILHIEELYNFHNSKTTDLYKSSYELNI